MSSSGQHRLEKAASRGCRGQHFLDMFSLDGRPLEGFPIANADHQNVADCGFNECLDWSDTSQRGNVSNVSEADAPAKPDSQDRPTPRTLLG
jgi:hypothetical protein